MAKLTFAIGDVHGCIDEFNLLIEKIGAYARERGVGKKFVLLGDYIDRGPDSKGVIDRIRKLQEDEEVVPLKGNHDHWLVQTRLDPAEWEGWHDWGGNETLASFGVNHERDVPEEYIDWINSLPLIHSDEQHYYVHAGLMPNAPVDKNTWEHLLWIRKDFMNSDYVWDKLVVHGHSARKKKGTPEIYPNRVNLDTFCFGGNSLTASVIDPVIREPLDYIQVPSAKVYWTRKED